MTETISERDRKSFLDLLDLAERVQAENELARRQLYFSVFGVIFGLLGTFATLVTFFGQSSSGNFALDLLLESPAGVLGLIAATAGYVAGTYVISRSLRKIRRERRAFEEVMGLVHEVYQATNDDLSAIERAEVKIRFSRLDI